MGEPLHSIVGDPQYVEVTATTNASGYLSYTFPNAINAAMVSVNEPQAGSGAGIVSASVTVTGPKSVKVRCWETHQRTPDMPVQASDRHAPGAVRSLSR